MPNVTWSRRDCIASIWMFGVSPFRPVQCQEHLLLPLFSIDCRSSRVELYLILKFRTREKRGGSFAQTLGSLWSSDQSYSRGSNTISAFVIPGFSWLIRHSAESFTPLFAELEDEDGCKRIKANSRAEEEDNINRPSDHWGGEEEEGNGQVCQEQSYANVV